MFNILDKLYDMKTVGGADVWAVHQKRDFIITGRRA